MAEKVIIAVDGGAASDAAVDWTIERSQLATIDVEIITVIESGWLVPGAPAVDYRAPYEEALSRASARLAKASPRTQVTTSTRFGLPADELTLASESADLLVVGTNKTRRIAGILHGTLPLKIAGRSKCPTVVVPAGWTPQTGPIVAAWDNDEIADVAVDFAAGEAVRLGLPLIIVHAWRVPATIGAELAGETLVLEDLVDAHQRMLRNASAAVRAAYPTVTVTEALKPGPIAVAVVEEAADAALLVVGSHGKGVIRDMLLGSISHDVLLNMPAPVVVVPRPAEPIRVYPEVLEEDLI